MSINYKNTPEYRDAVATVQQMINGAIAPLKDRISQLEEQNSALRNDLDLALKQLASNAVALTLKV